jgi:hypothetical protein
VVLDHFDIAYIDANLVKAIKFPMTLGDHYVKGDYLIYKLSVEHKSILYVTLSEDD